MANAEGSVMADEVPILTNHASATKSPVPACTGLGVSIIPAFHYSNPASRPGAGGGSGPGKIPAKQSQFAGGACDATTAHERSYDDKE